MNNSQKEYMLTKLKKECKVFYYKNQLKCKNPMDMTEMELMTFVDKNNLHQLYVEISNDTVIKFSKLENKFLEAKIPEEVKEILTRLMKFSEKSYLVGGCTRDIILGETVNDWDFVTDIPYEKLKEIFSAYSFKETGTEFLVFNLKFVTGEYEIANFRKDNYKIPKYVRRIK